MNPSSRPTLFQLCNVVVRRRGNPTLVAALDPQVIVEVPGRLELAPIVEGVTGRLDDAATSPARGTR